MRILITGGTGFVGRHLSRVFLEKGHTVTTTGTSPAHPLTGQTNFDYVRADTTKPGSWQTAVGTADAIVNLAGRTIFHRWSRAYKQQIIDSRVLTTRNLVDALPAQKQQTVLSASAVGYYGDRGDEVLTEDAEAGNDFLSQVGSRWEAEALRASSPDHRVVIMRFSVVLGPNGGALAQMVPAYKMYAGGPLGSGKQWFPWIHLDDLTAAVGHCLAMPSLNGPVNFCAPGIVTSKGFSRALGRALQRPAVMKVPKFALRMAMGEMGSVLLNSQRAVPARLLQAGFEFKYPEVDQALQQLLA